MHINMKLNNHDLKIFLILQYSSIQMTVAGFLIGFAQVVWFLVPGEKVVYLENCAA